MEQWNLYNKIKKLGSSDNDEDQKLAKELMLDAMVKIAPLRWNTLYLEIIPCISVQEAQKYIYESRKKNKSIPQNT